MLNSFVLDYQYLRIQTKASPTIEALLKDNVIGTPGLSMLYQHMGVRQKLYSIAQPHFITLQRQNKVVATCCFCERNFQGITGFYIRYFAFAEGFRLKGIPVATTQVKASALRAEIKSLLQGVGLVDSATMPFFHYAYVDPRNPRSANVCQEFGFIPIRHYTTRLFSRLFPKANSHLTIQQASADDEKVIKRLRSFYADYHHFQLENLRGTYYYVENEQGEMLAGLQVDPDAWRIMTLAGRYGKVLLNVFHLMPILSRLLSKNFKFLATEALYCKPGAEKILGQLLEALLHRHGLHTALIVLDTDSSLYQITQQLRLGILSKLAPEVHGHVIARYQGLDDGFLAQQHSRPVYISVRDLS